MFGASRLQIGSSWTRDGERAEWLKLDAVLERLLAA
jgi:hypothetical protein